MRRQRTSIDWLLYGICALVALLAAWGIVTLVGRYADLIRQVGMLQDQLEQSQAPEPTATEGAEIPRPAQLMVLFPIHWEDFSHFSSPFGERPKALSSSAGGENVEDHSGIDAVPFETVWNARVRPAAPGVVEIHWPPKGRPVPGYPGLTFSGDEKRGAWIEILHDTGWRTRYLHLSWTNPDVVREGRRVGVEDVIGRVGGSGLTTGSHLHFELINPIGRRVNPLLFFKDPREEDETINYRLVSAVR